MTNLERHLLYGKTVELCFDTDKHKYTIGKNTTNPKIIDKIGVVVDGCTSITGVIDKPMLKPWVAKVTCESIEKNLIVGSVVDEVSKMRLIKEAKGAYRQKSDDACGIGSLAHSFCEQWIKADIKYKLKNGNKTM